MVPGAGLEPARSCLRGILNPLCLPIPPPGPTNWFFIISIKVNLIKFVLLILEAEAGIEPAYTDLQSAA